MNIRTLEEDDILDCLELLKELTISDNNFDYNKVFNELLENKNSYIFVATTDENKVIGMATILIEQKLIHSGSRIGHIEDVVVSSNYRNLGIGQKLIEKCVKIAKERECYKVILDCDSKNAPFYSKIGFKEFGVSMKINF